MYWHIHLALMHICVKTKPTTALTSQIIVIHLSETNMLTILHIHARDSITFRGYLGKYLNTCVTYEVTDIKQKCSTHTMSMQ